MQRVIPDIFSMVLAASLTFNYLVTNICCEEMSTNSVPTEEETAMYPNEDLTLDRSYNNLTEINSHNLSKFIEVKMINLSHNSITLIDGNAFEGLYLLEEVDLSDNNLKNISTDLFSNNTNLLKVSLKKNKLLGIYYRSIEHIMYSTSLVHLDISFCGIDFFPQDAFSKLPNITTLDISGNPFKNLDLDFLKHLKHLKSLKIEFCNDAISAKFCNYRKKEISNFTLLPSCAHESVLSFSILTIGGSMCAGAFIFIIIAYLFMSRCKNRRVVEVANGGFSSQISIAQRPLPKPPLPNDGYEPPIIPWYGRITTMFHRNRQSKRESHYSYVSSEDSCDITDGTEYQDNTPSLTPNRLYSYSDANARDESYSSAAERIKLPTRVPKIPKLPTEFHNHSFYNSSISEEIYPFDEFEIIESSASATVPVETNVILPPIPPRRDSMLQTVVVQKNESETVFITSTFIELKPEPSAALQGTPTSSRESRNQERQTPPSIPPRISIR